MTKINSKVINLAAIEKIAKSMDTFSCFQTTTRNLGRNVFRAKDYGSRITVHSLYYYLPTKLMYVPCYLLKP